jgi:hypothetical protein
VDNLSTDVGKAPLRPNSISSVKDAVRKFRVEDADPSILLPTSGSPPGRGKGIDIKGKGRRRSASDDQVDDEYGSYSSTSSRNKGKGRAYESWSELADTSGVIRVRGKEQELSAAKEEQRRNERRWERDKDGVEVEVERAKDKEKIKSLEEEIRRLKDEVGDYILTATEYLVHYFPAFPKACNYISLSTAAPAPTTSPYFHN